MHHCTVQIESGPTVACGFHSSNDRQHGGGMLASSPKSQVYAVDRQRVHVEWIGLEQMRRFRVAMLSREQYGGLHIVNINATRHDVFMQNVG